MKKAKQCTLKFKSASVLAALAVMFVNMALDSACMCLYHQPEMPDVMKKMKRF